MSLTSRLLTVTAVLPQMPEDAASTSPHQCHLRLGQIVVNHSLKIEIGFILKSERTNDRFEVCYFVLNEPLLDPFHLLSGQQLVAGLLGHGWTACSHHHCK